MIFRISAFRHLKWLRVVCGFMAVLQMTFFGYSLWKGERVEVPPSFGVLPSLFSIVMAMFGFSANAQYLIRWIFAIGGLIVLAFDVIGVAVLDNDLACITSGMCENTNGSLSSVYVAFLVLRGMGIACDIMALLINGVLIAAMGVCKDRYVYEMWAPSYSSIPTYNHLSRVAKKDYQIKSLSELKAMAQLMDSDENAFRRKRPSPIEAEDALLVDVV